MPQQMTFAQVEYAAKKKQTRREQFLAEMEQVLPWAALQTLIRPHYYRETERGPGHPPIGLERMLRMYLLQQWYSLGDEALEDAVYDSHAFRHFLGIDLSRESVPDATTLLGFRHLLEAKGLQPFRAASVQPDKVTNNGEDWSYGFGLHVGWVGEINDQLSAGISYRSKVWMTKFDDYEGLFANGGEFDIPAMFNLGFAWKAQPNLTLAFDYQRIFYDEIDAIANSNDKDLTPCFSPGGPKPVICLGGKDGLGFGWDSVDVFKLGARYDANERLSFMGGVSYNTEFSSGRQALFNVLTPATVRWHITLGATYRHSDSDEFNLALAYMPKETLDGTSTSITQTQTGSIYMEQKDIEISWRHRF